jgi:hypothetical protein
MSETYHCAQVLPHLCSHYLEGFINGSQSFPLAMVTMASAFGNHVLVVNHAHRQWVAQVLGIEAKNKKILAARNPNSQDLCISNAVMINWDSVT